MFIAPLDAAEADAPASFDGATRSAIAAGAREARQQIEERVDRLGIVVDGRQEIPPMGGYGSYCPPSGRPDGLTFQRPDGPLKPRRRP